MSIPVIAFFNNKGGVGNTSLVYHVAWMLSDLGWRVVATDLDPQSNLSAAFLDDDRLDELWSSTKDAATIYHAVRSLERGIGDIVQPNLEIIEDNLALIPGDMALSGFEDELSDVWPKCLDRQERAFRVMSAFWRVMQAGAVKHGARVILVDLGPNLGAINRAALIASDHVIVPLAPDLFSLQGLRNLGPRLSDWRKGWKERIKKNPAPDVALPAGRMDPMGYIVMQHSVRFDRPVKSYEKWITRIPGTYRNDVLRQNDNETVDVTGDPYCLSLIKHYRSLMPMAHEARKPVFHLRPADGALGSHMNAVQEAHKDFEQLTRKILTLTRLEKL